MGRSTKADKARQLNAAFSMLRRAIALPEAMQALAREFGLSERQAYRYLEEAAHLEGPVEVSEACTKTPFAAGSALSAASTCAAWTACP